MLDRKGSMYPYSTLADQPPASNVTRINAIIECDCARVAVTPAQLLATGLRPVA